MDKPKKTFVSHPTTKHLFIVTSVWAMGILCLVLAITDFFKEDFFRGEQLMMYLLMGSSTAVTIEMYLNYFRPKKNV